MNLFTDYEIITKIQATGRKVIYRAVRKSDKIPVVAKVLISEHPTSEEIFYLQHEYEIAKKLELPGIVKPYNLVEYKNSIALIVEDFGGESLDRFLNQQKISLVTFCQIALQLVKILDEVHQSQIIHQDIKPTNIIINPQNLEVKITDFGIAIDAQESQKPTSFAGTLAYMSPEQTGKLDIAVDYRSDFYSLGVTFYQMLTGKLPFAASDSLELIHCHLAVMPMALHQLNREIPAAISQIVIKLLAKNPEDRYQSALGLKADLENCLTQLLHTGEIKPFCLGKLDQQAQLKISQKLYGRDSEMRILTLAWERVRGGATEIILVKGRSGTGKTALIREVQQLVVQHPAYFIEGKFEQLQRNIPYSGLIKALGNLIEQLLTENAANIQHWRSKILSCLGKNGKLITDVLPQVELIIGSQPEVLELSSIEARNRFNRLFKDFIGIFTQPEHPLMLFLDDLQWADLASLQFIERLIGSGDSQYLFIVGTYRDNEVSSTHPLIQTIDKIHQTNYVDQFNLQPLSCEQVNQLVADTLNCSPSNSLSLGELIFHRTEGNPFFINQLLQTLYTEKLLNFDLSRFDWQWNLEEIKAAGITSYNMAELVAKKLQKLPKKTLEAVKFAACLGNRFELDFLAIACEQSPSAMATDLWDALQAEIISPVNDTNQSTLIVDQALKSSPKIAYKFSHDRVQQAAYNLIPESEKSKIHHHIGKLLLSQTSALGISDQIFNLVNHFNLARSTFADRAAKNAVAKLNLIAGQKAKAATAYEAAVNYLTIGLELLPEVTWETDYYLMLDLHVEAVAAQYLYTNFQDADRLAELVFAKARTLLVKVKVSELKIHSHIAQNKMQSAIDMGMQILALLGICFSDRQEDIESEVVSLRTELEGQTEPVEALVDLPSMTNQEIVAAIDIMATMIPPVYIIQPKLFPLVVLKAVSLFLQYGNTKLSAFFYAVYGLLLCATGKIETGYRFGKLALSLLEKLSAPEIESKVNFTFNTMIRHWKEPGRATLNHFVEGIQSGIEVGDIEHACFHAKYYCTYLFLLGEPLKSAQQKSANYIELIQQLKQDFQLNYARIWHQVNLNLQGLAEDKLLLIGESFDESAMLPLLIETNNSTTLFALYLAKLMLNYLFKESDRALVNAHLAKQHAASAMGTMCFSTFNFYYSLALLAAYSTASPEEQIQYIAKVNSHQQDLEQWAAHSHFNYLHKYHLVEAELARVLGKNEAAADYYDLAIAKAREFGYLQEAAIAEELAAEFYWLRGKQRIARAYLADAHASFTRWGAVSKVRDLESRYPHLLNSIIHQNMAISPLNSSSKSIAGGSLAKLDLLSVIKASQAISSEIVLDNLLAKLMKIVIENAGAEKGLLFLKEGNSLLLVAESSVREQQPVALSQVKVDDHPNLPISVINYIQSTKKIVILDWANHEGLFTGDRYIIEHQVKSLLGLPILYQDQLQGIIYLENRLVRGTFTPKQLEILKVLISQVSISIENARLYKNLENHASVQKSLHQKEILLKEIHHRVKNNLLVVSHLLEFQADYIDDPKVIKMLENSQNRIHSMALVHEHLYNTVDLDKVDFGQYTQTLIEKLSYSHATEEKEISFSLDIDSVKLNIETANPCGLIINELISNAIEHAFPDHQGGNIAVSLKDNSDKLILAIQDDGIGLPDEFDLHSSDSLGLQLIATLVEQLNGTIELSKTNGANGTEIKITFSELHYAKRI